MTLPNCIQTVLSRLEAAGHEAWLAGGCVRDWLMHLPPHDYDVTTSASPEEMLAAFEGERVIETGLKHGTLTVLMDGTPVEVTVYRGPTIGDDLLHRDLTVNAMAYHPLRGLLDPCGGKSDLAACLLRAPGDPAQRFHEDPLRILRALRFSSVLGFDVENATLAAMRAQSQKLADVSAERLASEFIKLLCGPNVRKVVSLYTDILGAFIPEALPMIGFDQRNWHHIYTVLDHTACSLENVPPEPVLRLAVFFHDIGKPACFAIHDDGLGHFYGHAKVSADMADAVMKRLKLDNFTRERAVVLVREHDRQIEPTRTSVRRAMSRLGDDVFVQLIQVKRADNLGLNPILFDRQAYYDTLMQLREEILSSGECTTQRQLALTGRDLIAMGVKQGPEIGRMLNLLLEAVLSGKANNTPASLAKIVQKTTKSD
ncbi:MAG: CCA tRNA nucleotidyltransferase [Clostridia bacterium]|nr:CCA tRNA nucleotidyltransferase [Clostridia bacterium]